MIYSIKCFSWKSQTLALQYAQKSLYQQKPLINKHVLINYSILKKSFPVLIASSFLTRCTNWNFQSCRKDCERIHGQTGSLFFLTKVTCLTHWLQMEINRGAELWEQTSGWLFQAIWWTSLWIFWQTFGLHLCGEWLSWYPVPRHLSPPGRQLEKNGPAAWPQWAWRQTGMINYGRFVFLVFLKVTLV